MLFIRYAHAAEVMPVTLYWNFHLRCLASTQRDEYSTLILTINYLHFVMRFSNILLKICDYNWLIG